MKQSLFESRHQPQWQAFAEQLTQLEQGKAKAAELADFPHQYRRLCQHLAMAQERGYSSYLVDPLQQLAPARPPTAVSPPQPIGCERIGFPAGRFPPAGA